MKNSNQIIVMLRSFCSASQQLNKDEALNKDAFRETHTPSPRSVTHTPSPRSVVMRGIKSFFVRPISCIETLRDDGAGRCGFTLIELLVVVLIIGILSAIALPQYEKAVEKAKAAQAMTMMSSIVEAFKVYYLANGEYPTKFEELDVQVPFTGDSHTYTFNPSIDHTDWKSTDDWNIMIYKYQGAYGYGIQFMRNRGKYTGGGFAYFFYRSLGDAPLEQLFCMEGPDAGFTGESGRYCRKVIGGTRYKNGWAYTLP